MGATQNGSLTVYRVTRHGDCLFSVTAPSERAAKRLVASRVNLLQQTGSCIEPSELTINPIGTVEPEYTKAGSAAEAASIVE